MRKKKLVSVLAVLVFACVVSISAARQVFPVEFREVEVTPEILEKFNLQTLRTSGKNRNLTWTSPTAYHAVCSIGGEKREYWSLPYVVYSYSDVSSADSVWTATFKVAEYSQIGDKLHYGKNVFKYNNIKLAFRCGDNATFLRTFQSGRTLENKDSEAELTGGGLANRLTTEAGGTLDGRYVLKACTDYNGEEGKGDYFSYQGVLSSEVSGKNADDEGTLLIEFDRSSSFNSAVEHVEQRIPLPYSVRP